MGLLLPLTVLHSIRHVSATRVLFEKALDPPMPRLRALIESESQNAAITWLLVGVVVAGGVASLAAGDLLWALYSAVIVVVALVPPVNARDPLVLAAWPPLALAAVPVVVRWAGLFAQPLSYLSVAALALLVVVEVHTFSGAEMPPWFAVLFVVLTTLTVAGLWGVLQYVSDQTLGTSFLADRAELMWDLVAATAVGVGAGVLFEAFFREYGTLAEAAEEVAD